MKHGKGRNDKPKYVDESNNGNICPNSPNMSTENRERLVADDTTTAVISGAVKRHRGKPNGHGKNETIGLPSMEGREKETHYDKRDGLSLAKA